MTRDEYLKANPIEAVCESRGIHLLGRGAERKARCPFHKDRTPSLSVNVDKGIWRCFAGCGGGSVIDLLCKLDGISVGQFLKREEITNGQLFAPKRSNNMFSGVRSAFKPAPKAVAAVPNELPKPPAGDRVIDAVYSYTDGVGREVFQVVRYKPKDFRQRHRANGEWVWNMNGVERVLYRAQDVAAAERVIITEGEKDSDNLVGLGLPSTTNVGGAGKWLDSYSESLAGKEVIICGDNDKDREDGSNPGRDHVQQVFESVAGKAKSVKILQLPKTVKDVSDYIATFKTKERARQAIDELIDSVHPFVQGQKLPLYSLADIEHRYTKLAQNMETESFDLGKLFPGFRSHGVRPLVPGEVVSIVGDTGTAKTCLLQNIILAALPAPTLLFELELPMELMFERFVAQRHKMRCIEVEDAYRKGDIVGREALLAAFANLQICPESVLTLADLDAYIARSELKFGEPAKVVGLDYIQLVRGKGDRRERISDVAEGIKIIAKSRRVIIIMLSQMSRPKDGDLEVGLHDAKESGSIESSSGVVLGIWRDADDKRILHVKILKNTRGAGGAEILANLDGERMLLTERSKVDGVEAEMRAEDERRQAAPDRRSPTNDE